MKLKIIFNQNAILKFFVDHLEKMVLGLFIVIMAVILYGAVMNREKYEKTPQDLNNQDTAAQGKIGHPISKDDPIIKGLPAHDYQKIAKKIGDITNISVRPYQCDPWKPPLLIQKAPRGTPNVLPVQKLRATANFGAFMINKSGGIAERAPRDARSRSFEAAPGRAPVGGFVGPRAATSSETTGKCWVVVTGLVPYEDQLEAYKDAFKDAVFYDPANDVPVYQGCTIERAEISSPNEKPKWQKTFSFSNAVTEATKDWTHEMPDVIEEKYRDPALTFPLGPLTNNLWGVEVAHEPEIPLFSADAASGDTEGGRTAYPTNAEAPPAGGGGFEAPPPGARSFEAPPPGMRRPPVTTGRAPVRTDIRVEAPARVVDATGETAHSATQFAKYKLFRFFDFTVEPGKTYIYRVRLSLKNPNFGLKASQVKSVSDAKNATIESKKDDNLTTEIVYVPQDTQILVDSVSPKTMGNVSGKVLLKKWVKESGHQVFNEFSVDRGQVLNFIDEKGKPAPTDSASGGPPSEDLEHVNYLTDATVLDISGGKKLTIGRDRSLTEPGEMLMMVISNHAPLLMVRNELDDEAEIKRLTTESAMPPGFERRLPTNTRMPPGRDAINPRDSRNGGREGEQMLLEETPRDNTQRRPVRTRTP